MHDIRKYDEYDMNKLREAHKLLNEVYEYNYDYPPLESKQSRLCTIISKLEILLGEKIAE